MSGGNLSSHPWLHQTVGSRSQGQEVWLTRVSPDPSTVAGWEQRPLTYRSLKEGEGGGNSREGVPSCPSPGTGSTDAQGPSLCPELEAQLQVSVEAAPRPRTEHSRTLSQSCS